MRAVIGVDGGGTTTDVVVADLDGEVMATVRTGGTNHEMIGVDAMVEVLGAAVDDALMSANATRSEVAASVFGLAGVDWPSDVATIDSAIGALGVGGPRLVLNDCHVALRAGCSQPWGIVSSAGTGSVTAGRSRGGRWFRTMAIGWGEPSGAGTIARAALDAVAARHHRIGPATALSEALPAALDLADELEMFELISRSRTVDLRQLAPVVTLLATDGDVVARSIVTNVGVRHAEMVVGVARRLDMVDDEFELVTAGSVHAASAVFSEAFGSTVVAAIPNVTIVPLVTSPALGAVRLALDLVADDRQHNE